MSKKAIVISIAIFLLGVILICGMYGWFLKKQERVQKGLARSNFPYSDYTSSEWEGMYPQYLNENVKTTQSPEETYKKFREYLKNNDTDSALSLFFSRYKKDYQKVFDEAKNKGTVYSDLYLKLDEKIVKDEKNCMDTMCTYKMSGNQKSVRFIKNQNGVWLIELL